MSGNTFERLIRTVGPEFFEMVEGIAAWAVSLQGNMPLLKGLVELRDAVGADAAVLTRIGPAVDAVHHTITADCRSGERQVEAIDRSFAAALLGPYLFKSKVGSTWHLNSIDLDADPALSRLHRSRGLNELAVIVLETSQKSVFFLELHYEHRLRPEGRAALASLADTLTKLWTHRCLGSFSEALLKGRPEASKRSNSIALLSTENPAGLSRAEFRVCSLLSSGMSAARTRKELGISASTMRGHLSQIYSKTGAANLAELLFHLLASELPHGRRIASAPDAVGRAS